LGFYLAIIAEIYQMTVRFLNAGCGDAIHINFIGSDNKPHHILIDGGTEKGNLYTQTLQKEIAQILSLREQIDLWIITHIDDDHIGGILRLIRDEPLVNNINWDTCQIWFNYAPCDYDTGLEKTGLKSVRQGMLIRDFLRSKAKLNENITDATGKTDLFGLSLTVLSPDHKSFSELITIWEKQEVSIRSRKSSTFKASKSSDYAIQLTDFDHSVFTEDGSEENASSIALLLEYKDAKILLTADSHPSILANSLRKLGYSNEPGKRLQLSLMQVPHHGSKGNCSAELLDLVDTQHFVFSADGLNRHNLPNKETFARIIHSKPGQPIDFYITQHNDRTKSIFAVDTLPPQIQIHFAEPRSQALTFNFG
jgi:beta-lactamase superfamily II metal-dependent hydrolase